jgi:hypothetical protein
MSFGGEEPMLTPLTSDRLSSIAGLNASGCSGDFLILVRNDMHESVSAAVRYMAVFSDIVAVAVDLDIKYWS